MAVGSSTIKMRAIFNEINGTSYTEGNFPSNLDCKMSEFNADSNAYTSGSADHTGVNTTNDVLATPDTIAEWAGYTHALSMGTIVYGVRMGTTSQAANYGLLQASTDDTVDENAHACGGVTVWRIHDGSNTYIKVKFFGDALGDKDIYDTSNTAGVTNTTGTTIITIPTTDVTINATVSYIAGQTVTYPFSGHLAAFDDISGTGAALLVCKGAEQADADPGSDDEFHSKFHIALSASKTGYTTTLLNKGSAGNGIIVHSTNSAAAESEE